MSQGYEPNPFEPNTVVYPIMAGAPGPEGQEGPQGPLPGASQYGIKSVTVTMGPSEVLNLAETPIVLLPLTAGVITPLGFTVNLHFNSIAYANTGGYLEVTYPGGELMVVNFNSVADITGTQSQMINLPGYISNGGGGGQAANFSGSSGPFYIGNNGTDYTTGNSFVSVTMVYFDTQYLP